MADAGFWILDAGFSILDSRCWILDSGCWILDSRCWILDAGFSILDSGFWILDAGWWIVASLAGSRDLGSALRGRPRDLRFGSIPKGFPLCFNPEESGLSLRFSIDYLPLCWMLIILYAGVGVKLILFRRGLTLINTGLPQRSRRPRREDRGQKTENKGQRTEDGRRRTDDILKGQGRRTTGWIDSGQLPADLRYLTRCRRGCDFLGCVWRGDRYNWWGPR